MLLLLQMSGGDLGVSAFPVAESIFTWVGTIEGGKGTLYEGLSYKLSLRFPMDYPFKPPQVKFDTMCFHPNVDQFGNICLDILQVFIKLDNKSTYTRAKIFIMCICCLGFSNYMCTLRLPRISICGWNINFSHTCFYRTSGLQHMTVELFFCLFKVYWKVCSSFILSFVVTFTCLSDQFFRTTEPNLESPLNSYAAELWNDKEG